MMIMIILLLVCSSGVFSNATSGKRRSKEMKETFEDWEQLFSVILLFPREYEQKSIISGLSWEGDLNCSCWTTQARISNTRHHRRVHKKIFLTDLHLFLQSFLFFISFRTSLLHSFSVAVNVACLLCVLCSLIHVFLLLFFLQASLLSSFGLRLHLTIHSKNTVQCIVRALDSCKTCLRRQFQSLRDQESKDERNSHPSELCCEELVHCNVQTPTTTEFHSPSDHVCLFLMLRFNDFEGDFEDYLRLSRRSIAEMQYFLWKAVFARDYEGVTWLICSWGEGVQYYWVVGFRSECTIRGIPSLLLDVKSFRSIFFLFSLWDVVSFSYFSSLLFFLVIPWLVVSLFTKVEFSVLLISSSSSWTTDDAVLLRVFSVTPRVSRDLSKKVTSISLITECYDDVTLDWINGTLECTFSCRSLIFQREKYHGLFPDLSSSSLVFQVCRLFDSLLYLFVSSLLCVCLLNPFTSERLEPLLGSLKSVSHFSSRLLFMSA